MAYIGAVGKRITTIVIYQKRHEYRATQYGGYGLTTHFIHRFVDKEGNMLVWKSNKMVEYINDGKDDPGRKNEVMFALEGSEVELIGTVKEHGDYKGENQTVVTRCRFRLLKAAKTKEQITQERAAEQMASIGERDQVREMPYKQYKAHYADCEAVVGSYKPHIDISGFPQGPATIKVIIREGRLKPSGVRGERFYGFRFITDDGKHVTYRAVSEENARKQLAKDFPNSGGWECDKRF